jgi:predicted MFS family arabinose efflux permease
LNTMVWTHLPSSVFLIAAPASPTAAVAAALFLAREALVEMDVPTRQSYVMAVVKPAERTFASGVTNVTRNVAWAVGPSFAGLVMQHVALAGPLVIGGTLKRLPMTCCCIARFGTSGHRRKSSRLQDGRPRALACRSRPMKAKRRCVCGRCDWY